MYLLPQAYSPHQTSEILRYDSWALRDRDRSRIHPVRRWCHLSTHDYNHSALLMACIMSKGQSPVDQFPCSKSGDFPICRRICVCPSLPSQQVVVVGFGPPQPATWSYHAADCQPTAPAPVPLVSLHGRVCWNSLPDYLKSSDLSFNCFRQQLKTFLFCKYWHQSQHYFSDIRDIVDALYKCITYLRKS